MPEQKRQHNGVHSPSDYRPADLGKTRVKGKGSQPDKEDSRSHHGSFESRWLESRWSTSETTETRESSANSMQEPSFARRLKL